MVWCQQNYSCEHCCNNGGAQVSFMEAIDNILYFLINIRFFFCHLMFYYSHLLAIYTFVYFCFSCLRSPKALPTRDKERGCDGCGGV